MARYPTDLKASVIQKMLPPNNVPEAGFRTSIDCLGFASLDDRGVIHGFDERRQSSAFLRQALISTINWPYAKG